MNEKVLVTTSRHKRDVYAFWLSAFPLLIDWLVLREKEKEAKSLPAAPVALVPCSSDGASKMQRLLLPKCFLMWLPMQHESVYIFALYLRLNVCFSLLLFSLFSKPCRWASLDGHWWPFPSRDSTPSDTLWWVKRCWSWRRTVAY